ncbi:MAG: ATP phosphoribosyltransferase regulatory subunit [Pseudomonadota bacterium]
MREHNTWLLPDGIEELLPPEAAQVEALRRDLLDLYQRWGYELVMTPFIEYLDSLLTGTGSDLDVHTFKLTDQVSGRMMGVRADITPQVARIDAHRLRRNTPTRLCYMGSVLRTRSMHFGGTRNPLQVGAELFGHDGIASDVEILLLMLETIRAAGVKQLHVDLGHVGVYRALVRQTGLEHAQEMALFEALQRKAIPEISTLIDDFSLSDSHAAMLKALAQLNGDETVIDRARELLVDASDEVHEALDYLQQVAIQVKLRVADLSIHYDLAELRAYHYQTGVVFAAFTPGSGTEIARGGRYNDVGKAFGRARPATGFSAYLKVLVRVAGEQQTQQREAILASWSEDAGLLSLVEELRNQGKCVIWELPGQQGDAAAMRCTSVIRQKDKSWVIEKL